MFPVMPLVVLLIVAAPTQEPAGGTKAAAVAPFIGDEVAVVVHLDLTNLDVQRTVRRVLGKLADENDVSGATNAASEWVNALKAAGVHDLYVLVDPADIPGYPLAVVPLVGGADGKAIAGALSNGVPNSPIRWPASETIRGAVVAGKTDALPAFNVTFAVN